MRAPGQGVTQCAAPPLRKLLTGPPLPSAAGRRTIPEAKGREPTAVHPPIQATSAAAPGQHRPRPDTIRGSVCRRRCVLRRRRSPATPLGAPRRHQPTSQPNDCEKSNSSRHVAAKSSHPTGVVPWAPSDPHPRPFQAVPVRQAKEPAISAYRKQSCVSPPVLHCSGGLALATWLPPTYGGQSERQLSRRAEGALWKRNLRCSWEPGQRRWSA